MSVDVKIDGLMLIVIGVVVAGSIVYVKRNKILNSIDPTHDDNLANKGFHSIVKAIDPNETRTYGEYLYENKSIHPLAWLFQGIGALTGDLP